MSDTLDAPVPLGDTSENETQSLNQIVSELDQAGRAWAKAKAAAVLRESREAAVSIMGAAGLDPPASDSLSPQWPSESADTLEKHFYLKFLDNIGLHLFRIGTEGDTGIRSGYGSGRLFPNATRANPAARAVAGGGEGRVSESEQSRSVQGACTAQAGAMQEVDTGYFDQVVADVAPDTTMNINGVPFALASGCQLRATRGNWSMAGFDLLRSKWSDVVLAIPKGKRNG